MLNPNIVKNSDFPLLAGDPLWKKMTLNIQSRKMKQLVQKIKEHLSELDRTKKNIPQLKAKKKQLTKEILDASHQVNESQGDSKKVLTLDKKRDELKATAKQIEEEYLLLEELPRKTQELNLELLKETAVQVYTELIDHDKMNQKLDHKIQGLRNELNQLREEKETIEAKLENWYSFLHHLVGPKEMEALDQQISFQPLENKKDMVEE